MKYVAVLLFLNASLNCFAQKDKILTWLAAEHGEAAIQISNHSIKVGDNFMSNI